MTFIKIYKGGGLTYNYIPVYLLYFYYISIIKVKFNESVV